MEIPETSRLMLLDLARRISQTSDMRLRKALFGQFEARVLSHIDRARDRGEASTIRVYIDRLGRLSPTGEHWQAMFEGLQKTLADESAACELH